MDTALVEPVFDVQVVSDAAVGVEDRESGEAGDGDEVLDLRRRRVRRREH